MKDPYKVFLHSIRGAAAAELNAENIDGISIDAIKMKIRESDLVRIDAAVLLEHAINAGVDGAVDAATDFVPRAAGARNQLEFNFPTEWQENGIKAGDLFVKNKHATFAHNTKHDQDGDAHLERVVEAHAIRKERFRLLNLAYKAAPTKVKRNSEAIAWLREHPDLFDALPNRNVEETQASDA